ncbi:hypothetical protein PFISCL1PPCAC_23964, partial [Pristionchus fissidentatus]
GLSPPRPLPSLLLDSFTIVCLQSVLTYFSTPAFLCPTTSLMMMPVLLQSSLSSMMLPASANDSVIRGRKRTNETFDGHIFSKRNSNSDLSDDDSSSTPRKGSPGVDDERRAHHNELERRRRDHIKDHFMCLKEAIPLLEGEKSSRALILKRAVEYIAIINQRVAEQAMIIEELQRKNDNIQISADPMVSAVAATPSPVLLTPSPLLAIPTTSSPVAPATATVPAPITIEVAAPSVVSSFSPVIPSKPSVLRFPPPPPTMADLAMLLALQQQQQQQKDTQALLTKDLATLLSLNSLKDQSAQFMTPMLF